MKIHVRNLIFAAIAGSLAACSPQGASTSSTAAPAAPATPAKTAPPPAAAASTTLTATPAPTSSAAPATPGGSIEQAASAALGAQVEGEIRNPDQTDFYRFDVPLKLRDLAIVRLQNKSSTLKPYFKLYNNDRSQLAESYDGTPGASVERTLTLEPGKTIYVAVQNYGSTGKYALSITPQKAYDSYEPNDDSLSATPIAIGTAIEANIMDDKDTDWFRITGATEKGVHVTFDNLSSTLKPYVKVYSSTKSQTSEKYDGTPGANLDFSIDVEPGKDFYLQVVPYGGSGKYRLTAK